MNSPSVLEQPNARGVAPRFEVVQPVPATWSTPGSLLAAGVAHLAEVRLVAERLEVDRYAVFVVLDADPEATLNAIIEVESALYVKFKGLPFDVRIMTPAKSWSDEDLRKQTILHYERRVPDGSL